MTGVKICGITRMEDARLAAALGASAIGFVFWPGSPRFVTPAQAREIAAAVPPFVARVGVFVNQPAGHVSDVASEVGLDVVQLHGNEDVAYARLVGRRVIRAAALSEASALVDGWPAAVTLLIDAIDGERRGGTGRPVDWGTAAALAARRPIILAGGLRPENVEEAIRRVRPLAVDVSSGVESEPGVKDGRRLREFFSAVTAAEGETR